MKMLVTGAAGFIGYHLILRLLKEGNTVYGLDNINNYYDVSLKYARLKASGINIEKILSEREITSNNSKYTFKKVNIEDKDQIEKLMRDEKFDIVCHLAAQAGVRYSLENPYAYINSNIVGFLNILEGCRNNSVRHLVYASSSSVYGLNKKFPFSVSDNVNHPISLYAATKKSNELMAHTYSYLYQIPTTGLRFFTVYGPWGRPDMALYIFTKNILEKKPIYVFNNGNMKRDFTYIDDVIEGIIRILPKAATPDISWEALNPNPSSSSAPYRLYNIGGGKTVPLMKYIEIIENILGIKAEMKYLPMQSGDVEETCANTVPLQKDFGYTPETTVYDGVENFVKWYKKFYNVKK